MFLIASYEKSYCRRIDGGTWERIVAMTTSRTLFGSIKRCEEMSSSSSSSSMKGLTSSASTNPSPATATTTTTIHSAVVQLVLSSSLRVGYCLLSPNIRLSMNIPDYSMVTIDIIHMTQATALLLPRGISLIPFYWKSRSASAITSSSSQSSSSSSSSSNDEAIIYDQELVKAVLMNNITSFRDSDDIAQSPSFIPHHNHQQHHH